MPLNRINASQIKDTDLITESELAQLNPAYNVFLTKVGTTKVKVVSSASAPSALTVGEVLRYNTSNTSTLTLTGSAGIYDIFAIADNPSVKSFTIDFAPVGQDPTGATLFRKIGSVSWDGSAISAVSSLSDFGLVEAQTPSIDGQTIFVLNNIAYAPGTNDLSVYVNGSREALGVNYEETDTQTVTFIGGSSLTTSDTILFVVSSGRGGISGSAVIATSGGGTAATTTYNNTSSGLAATNVQTALDEVVSDINALTTSSISEGSNLYFTTERAQDAVGTILTDSSTVDFTYNDAGNSITASVIQTALDHTNLQNIGTNTHTQIDSHIASTSNPHSVTKAQVGLGNVVNADTTTTANITDSTDKRFVTDAELTVLSNTSGVNTGDQDLSGLVPKTTTVNGHALSSNVTVTKSDVGLGNVTNALQLVAANNFSDLTSVSTAKTNLSLVKGDVGLGNVDNTSDATKNSATATLTNKTIDGGSNIFSNIPNTAITGLGTASTHAASDFLAITGGTLTGDLILNADPSQALGAATKQYVDAVATGLQVKASVQAATTANLTATYSNGSSGVGATLTNSGTQVAFTVDGYSASVNDRILVKNQTAALQNGVYVVTTVGSGSTNWVLTRATDYDNSPAGEVAAGDFTFVDNGTVNQAIGFVQTLPSPVTVGTTAINFTQFSGAGEITAGNGITKTGNTLSVNESQLSLGNIGGTASLTSQVSGILPIANGGTNASSASGARTSLGLGNVDNTSDATKNSATVTLTNKTLDNTNTVTIKDSLFTLQDDVDTTKQAQFQLSGITASTTRTFTLPDANTTLVGTDTTQTLTNKTINGSNNTITNISLTTAVTGILPIANGGTGQNSKTAAYDALSPTTTLGDIEYNNGTNNVRLAGNTTTAKQYLSQTGNGSVSAAPVWATIAASDITGLGTLATQSGTAPSGTIVGTTDTQILTNKTIGNTNSVTVKDANFTIQDDADTTKQVQFQLGGNTSGTTRTLTVPNFDGTIATLAGSETLTNKTLTTPIIAVISNSGNLTLPSGTNDTLVARATTDTLSNKTLDNTTTATIKDGSFTLQNTTTTSKQLRFSLSGITAANTRTLTVPDFNGTIATLAGTETFTNKTLTSPTITTPTISSIVNSGTLTLPTSTDTLVGRATTDLLTNKTIVMSVVTGTNSSFTPDASTGNHFQYTLNGNTTINAPTNPSNGQKIMFELIQDATGSRTVTFSTGTGGFAYGTDITGFTATTTASKTDFVGAVYNSTANKWRIIAIVKGY